MDGDTRISDRIVGRLKGEAWVTVDARLEWKERPAYAYPFTNIEHAPIFGYWEFSAMGGMYARRNSPDMFAAGQILGDVKRVSGAGHLAALWERWHLNGMKAGCIHQGAPVMRKGKYGTDEVDYDAIPPCPVTGYKYGSGWLVEEIPAETLAEIRAELARLADMPRWHN